MKNLVTGGLGFISSKLTQELHNRVMMYGHVIFIIHINLNIVILDVTSGNINNLKEYFNEYEFDYVYNLATEYGRWNREKHSENL